MQAGLQTNNLDGRIASINILNVHLENIMYGQHSVRTTHCKIFSLNEIDRANAIVAGKTLDIVDVLIQMWMSCSC